MSPEEVIQYAEFLVVAREEDEDASFQADAEAIANMIRAQVLPAVLRILPRPLHEYLVILNAPWNALDKGHGAFAPSAETVFALIVPKCSVMLVKASLDVYEEKWSLWMCASDLCDPTAERLSVYAHEMKKIQWPWLSIDNPRQDPWEFVHAARKTWLDAQPDDGGDAEEMVAEHEAPTPSLWHLDQALRFAAGKDETLAIVHALAGIAWAISDKPLPVYDSLPRSE